MPQSTGAQARFRAGDALDTHLHHDEQRTALFRLCYRMTGSAADAEDLVQETFVRALERPPADTSRPLTPWLVQVAINLSRDHLRRRKREAYVGPWLPAPLRTEGWESDQRPDTRYGALESVSMAFLVALEALSATQRAVVVLCDVLGYSVREAAETLALGESNVKTTHHRARAALAAYDGTRRPITPAEQARTRAALEALLIGFARGDVAALERILADGVCALNDSDGEFHAARVPVTGLARVIKFHLKVARPVPPVLTACELNGLPALLGEYAHAEPALAPRFALLIALDEQARVVAMNTTVARRKLAHLFAR